MNKMMMKVNTIMKVERVEKIEMIMMNQVNCQKNQRDLVKM